MPYSPGTEPTAQPRAPCGSGPDRLLFKSPGGPPPTTHPDRGPPMGVRVLNERRVGGGCGLGPPLPPSGGGRGVAPREKNRTQVWTLNLEPRHKLKKKLRGFKKVQKKTCVFTSFLNETDKTKPIKTQFSVAKGWERISFWFQEFGLLPVSPRGGREVVTLLPPTAVS